LILALWAGQTDGAFLVIVSGHETAVGETPCERAPAHSMLAKNRRVYAGDFPSAYNGKRGKIMFKRIKQLVRMHRPPKRANAATAGRALWRWRHLFIARTTLN
jgi:hypothetical protein